jgi:hypothetical protein
MKEEYSPMKEEYSPQRHREHREDKNLGGLTHHGSPHLWVGDREKTERKPDGQARSSLCFLSITCVNSEAQTQRKPNPVFCLLGALCASVVNTLPRLTG